MTARRASSYRWAVLVAATLAVCGALGLGRFGYASVLPAMQEGLGLSNTQAGALASWNLAGYVAMAFVAGLLATRFGARAVITIGLVVAASAMALTGLVDSFAGAAAARALTGMGGGMVNVPAVALMSIWFTSKRRGLASGFVVSGSSLALVVVGPTVPRLIEAAGADGWRATWLVFGAVTLAVAVVAGLILRDHPADALAAAPETGRAPHADHLRRADLRRIIASRYFWGLGAVYLCFGFSYMIYMTFFVRRLTGDLGFSAADAGSLFMILGWASLVCGVTWGFASDVIGRKSALAIVCFAHAVAFALFALASGGGWLTVSAAIFGLSAWSVPAIMGAAAGDGFGPAMAPSALGFLTLFLGVGQAVGPLVGGALADAGGSFRPAFLLAATVALAGSVAAMLAPRPQGDPELVEGATAVAHDSRNRHERCEALELEDNERI